MNKSKLLIAGFIGLVGFSACKTNKVVVNASTEVKPKKENQIMTTESGLKVEILEKGAGKKPNVGDKVTVHYTGKLTNDTVFDSSVNRGTPFSFQLGVGQVIRGWDEGIGMLEEGTKARLTIPAELGYGNRAAGSIPPNSTLIFDVELLKVIEKINPKPYDIAGKTVLKTASGLEYVKLNTTDGVQAAAGKNVKVHYTGYFEDGKIFDSSVSRGEPIDFPLGKGYVIPGWDEGIALLKVGEKARLIIPYQLAYGEAGRPGAIPPKATLIFDVELIEVK
jgi:peptidylprolyl isomerase